MSTTYSRTEIHQTLPPGAPDRRLIVVREIGSTQDAARRLAEEGAPHGSLVLADCQLEGRGRGGRTWFSPPGAGIWMSLVLRPALDPAHAPFLSLASGVATAEAIETVAGPRVQLKWPNDLIAGGRKLGGVLVDTASLGAVLTWCLVGIGINVRGETASFPPELRDIAVSLEMLGARALAREPLIGAIAGALLRRIRSLEQGGAADLLTAYSARDALAGRTVWVDVGGGEVITGRAAGIASDGALRVDTPSGSRSLHVGSVIRIEP